MQTPQPLPLSKEGYFKQATGLITATIPMLGVNMIVYGLFFLASVVWFAVWAGIAFLTAKIAPAVAYICVIVALAAAGGLARFARRYILYMVKGAHIAAMTETLMGRKVPGGFAQLAYGRQIIESRFKDVSMLFGLDVMITGTLKAISRKILKIASWLPLPGGAKNAVQIAVHIVERSLTYVDEAILSYAIYRNEENVWNSARHGIVLYGQAYKPILITAAKCYVLGKIMFFGLFALFAIPFFAITTLFASATGDTLSIIQFVILILAAIAAYLIQLALFEPFALAYTMVTYHREIVGKVPDPAWDQRLQELSKSFKQLVTSATSFASAKTNQAAANTPHQQPFQQQPYQQQQQQQFQPQQQQFQQQPFQQPYQQQQPQQQPFQQPPPHDPNRDPNSH